MQDQDYQIFEAYLAGDLPADKVRVHEEKIEQDQDYKESFELYKSLNQHLENKEKNEKELEQFKNTVSDISDNYFATRKKTKFAWVKMAVAASIIIAIGLYFLIGEISKPQYQEIAQIPTIHLTERSADGEIYVQAEEAFNQEQYTEAIKLFGQILQEDNQNQSISLYQAIAFMEIDSANRAKELYDKIIEKENAYSEEALWYAALNELKEENYTACKEYLTKINPSASRYEDAQNLLEKL
ncbi:tetratricopeptide repeat protein [Marivirga salinae]|uniref:Tetratricopeptide repeat protein n=1 Tax=Marivirga salinarum TaxID=3059078 RepID=A0AA51N8N2_9BACT|nr:tetratricopeptide repeat protein [Marivirga sp. BDSF4-3]WMN10714.1 tetratricopeptide repeat protein [Marivirga sp. BDSF4-3]